MTFLEGLVGDGATDNTAILNRILADGSGPLHLQFPPGRYLLSGDVHCSHRSLRLEGAGVEGTVLVWAGHGGFRFAGDFTHRLKMTDLSLITTVEGNASPAITVTATDTWPNTIGNQLKLSDLAIRPSGFAAGGYFSTGIRIDGGIGGLGNASIRDVLVQGNSAVGPVLAGKRGPVAGTIGVHLVGRTYGIRVETSQFTWLDYALKGQDQIESAQWIGSSAGACRYGFYVDSLTFPNGLTNSMTVERGDFACIRRAVYLDKVWQSMIQGNTILNYPFPIPGDSWVGVDFPSACGQNRILGNLIYPTYDQGPCNKFGVSYAGTRAVIANNVTEGCTIPIYFPNGPAGNTISANRTV